MIITKKDTTTIITQEKATVIELVSRITEKYETWKNDNLIINLFSLDTIQPEDVNEFLLLSRKHKSAKRSFILVSSFISYDQIPKDISLTPTLEEAHNLIEMEEIERDLEL